MAMKEALLKGDITGLATTLSAGWTSKRDMAADFAQLCKVSTERTEAPSAVAHLVQNSDGILLALEKAGTSKDAALAALRVQLEDQRAAHSQLRAAVERLCAE